jgi:uridine phosphorylase
MKTEEFDMKTILSALPVPDEDGRFPYTGLAGGQLAADVLMPGDPGRSRRIASRFEQARDLGIHGACAASTGTTEAGHPISVLSSGMGAAAVTEVVREAKAMQVQSLIRVGTCGGIGEEMKPGTILIAAGAVRGDGASGELAPAGYPAVPDLSVTRALCLAAREMGEEAVLGLYRSHDAFYRESKAADEGMAARMALWKEANVQAVENESAALFTAGRLLGVAAGTICVILSNMLAGDTPENNFMLTHPDKMQERVDTAIAIAIRAVDILAEGRASR